MFYSFYIKRRWRTKTLDHVRKHDECQPAGSPFLRNMRRMKTKQTAQTKPSVTASHDDLSTDLKDSPMMSHLLEALEGGTDIGEYGRLTFVMISRHFLEEEEIVTLLNGQPGFDDDKSRALYLQVQERDYSPPKRDRIIEWQGKQEFQICPTPDDPATCNVYKELKFPDEIYEHIAGFWEVKAHRDESSSES